MLSKQTAGYVIETKLLLEDLAIDGVEDTDFCPSNFRSSIHSEMEERKYDHEVCCFGGGKETNTKLQN